MDLIFVFITALLTTALFTPLTIKLATKYGLVDDPSKRPHPAHLHTRVIPRAGGLPIYIGILVSILLFLPLQKYLIGIILGITLLLIMGLMDDKLIKFNPYVRLILLFLAASFAVGSGIGITFITNPLSHLGLEYLLPGSIIYLNQINLPFSLFGEHNIILVADLFAFFWIVTLTQIINWSKGVDGQMPGVTLVSSLTLALLSLKFYYQGDLHQLEVVKLSLITSGVSLGFLIFNWYPSKILPGFSASTILAFMLAVLSILSGAKVATALVVLAIPTADFLYTIIRRVSAGKSPVWGDRGHLHHHLLDLGYSHSAIALFYILGSAILGAISLLIPATSKIYLVILSLAGATLFILWISSFGGLLKRPDPDNG